MEEYKQSHPQDTPICAEFASVMSSTAIFFSTITCKKSEMQALDEKPNHCETLEWPYLLVRRTDDSEDRAVACGHGATIFSTQEDNNKAKPRRFLAT